MRHIGRSVFAASLLLTAACGSSLPQDRPASELKDAIRRYEWIASQPGGREDSANWLRLAQMYQWTARYGDAERAYGRAMVLLRTNNPGDLASSMDLLGMLYAQEGKLSKAEETEMAALQMQEASRDHLGVGLSWMNLSMILLGEHRVSEAERYGEWAVDRLVGEGNTKNEASIAQQMTALLYLSEVRSAEKDYAGAIKELLRARDLGESQSSPSRFALDYIDFLLGYAYWKSGEPDRAAELMKTGAAGIQAELGWRHPTCIKLMRWYEEFLRQTQRRAEAADLRRARAKARAAKKQPGSSGTAMTAFRP